MPGQLCAILQVSRSGYYRWLNEPESRIVKRDEPLEKLIKDIFFEMGQIYGYLLITIELNRWTNQHNNRKRHQIKLNGLTPVEFRDQAA